MRCIDHVAAHHAATIYSHDVHGQREHSHRDNWGSLLNQLLRNVGGFVTVIDAIVAMLYLLFSE